MVTNSPTDTPTPSHIRCPRCLLEKPRREFKRLASLSQTRQWLRNPNAQTRHAYIGKFCNACHNKRKPSDLSPSEHRKRLINEGKSVEYADMTYEMRRAQGKKRLAESAKRTRKKRYATILEDHIKHINNLLSVTRAKCEYHYAKTTDIKTKMFQANAEMILTQAKRELKDMGTRGATIPPDWRRLVEPEKTEALRHAYAEVRGELQDRVVSVVLAITGDRKTS